MSFQLDPFLTSCKAAVAEANPQPAITELVERAVSEPGPVQRAFGESREGGIQRLHVSPELTILHVVWAPHMMLLPHDHLMWAVIGVYSGREDNIFWRRIPEHPAGKIEAAGAVSLGPGDTRPLGRDLIHSVANPTTRFTGAIHIYGGDFFAQERNEWDPETLHREPYNLERNLQRFADANAAWAGSRS